MQVKCDYCEAYLDDTDEFCPSCGAPNQHLHRTASDTPKTIEQLKIWYKAMNLPPENVTRFFIGKDIKEPRAFGIYQDAEGDFVVYKNKSDGSRAVRYEGKDEAYAVNELYLRLKSEIIDQKQRNANKQTASRPSNTGKGPRLSPKSLFRLVIYIIILCFIIGGVASSCSDSKRTGYYNVGNSSYYYDNTLDNWYQYDTYSDDWVTTSEPETTTDDSVWDSKIDDFESDWDGATIDYSDSYQSDWDSYDSSNSSYSSSDSYWDSDDSWDSGGWDSWDSGGWDSGGWDSDW